MFCRNCGKKIPDDALHCPYCGEKTYQAVEIVKQNGSGKKKKRKKRHGRRIIAALLVILIAISVGSAGVFWNRYGWYATAKSEWKEKSKIYDDGVIYPMRDTTEKMAYAHLNFFVPDLTTLEEDYFFFTEEGLMAGRHSEQIQSVSCQCTSGTEDSEDAENIFKNMICTEENGKITYLKVGNISADYSYDQKGRVQERTYHYKNEVSIIEEYRYDQNGHVTEHAYYEQEKNKKKALITRCLMTYDSYGNRTELKEYHSEDSKEPEISSRANYQYNGKVPEHATAVTKNNGSEETYQAEYNKAGQVTEITGKGDANVIKIEIKYNQGHPVVYHYYSDDDRMGEDDTKENYTYSDGCRSNLKQENQVSEESWQTYDVDYDELGRVIKRVEEDNFGIMGLVHEDDYANDSAQTIQNYSYDESGRLVGMKYRSGRRDGSDVNLAISIQY